MTEQPSDFVVKFYALFNARDTDGVFEHLHPDVTWANGMEGGHVQGLKGVRKYWTRQWELISSKVTPLDTRTTDAGLVVSVRQEVFTLEGKLLSDSYVSHAFSILDGKITRFDILES